jgi:fructose transport system substrate-binding protein
VQNVQKGIIGATSQQYPLKMAQDGVQAVVDYAKSQKKPAAPAGKDFINTGVTLITDKPAGGVPSKDTKFGLANCWG